MPIGWRSVCLAALLSGGCAVNAPKIAAVPAAPAPKPDPPALIFAQTALELPDPQPVPPEALPRRDLPVSPPVVEAPAPRILPRRPAATVNKREPEVVEQAAPKPSINRTPLVPGDSDAPRPDLIQKRLDSIKGMQARLSSKTGKDAETTRSRIQFFIDEASQALARKDLRQADSLISRAEVLAKDLLGVH